MKYQRKNMKITHVNPQFSYDIDILIWITKICIQIISMNCPLQNMRLQECLNQENTLNKNDVRTEEH
jgi:hypothetical protein